MSNDLFEYGIQTEASDIRAHVSVVNRTIYVFKTQNGIEAIERIKPALRTAKQDGYDGVTAEGWIVPVDAIKDVRALRYDSWKNWGDFTLELNTSQKGVLAVKCVCDCMRAGRFPFWVDAMEDDRENIQVKGTDIVVFCRKKIQVKCDWRSGHKPNGTGNLFLQRAEKNPFRRI